MLTPKTAAAPEPDPAPSLSPDFSAMLAAVSDPEPEASVPVAEMLANDPQLVDPEDITFEPEPEPEPDPEPATRQAPPPQVMRASEPPPVRVPEPRPEPRPAMSVAQAAPMPDPTLSEDIAEQLLAPATEAAAQGAMARLGAMASSGGIGGMTVEGMIRDMLKPMLKDWLDENLPSLVERMVEKEIARISRGVK
jgi:cell pole-organizing protein PopZ